MPKPKRRTGHEVVRASITIDVATHARWSAAAALARMDRSEFAVEAIRAACRGLFLTDRRKPQAGQAKFHESAEVLDLVEPDGPDAAA